MLSVVTVDHNKYILSIDTDYKYYDLFKNPMLTIHC